MMLNAEAVKERRKASANLIEQYLESAFPKETLPQKKLFDAMRYSLLGGGKRIRPILCLEVCRLLGGELSHALPMAAAVELIHAFSLIHDDLPCMDNDDYRRGKPTCHKIYGEDTALLAGDALLTMAFEVIARSGMRGEIPMKLALEATALLGECTGALGMTGGQQLDIEFTGMDMQLDELKHMYRLKTGSLLTFACVSGALAAGADEATLEKVRLYAEKIGLCFQIVDDLLDMEGDSRKTGKAVGQDRANHKRTLAFLLGPQQARQLADQLTDEAIQEIASLGNGEFLIPFTEYLLKREM